jgi:16S rRNA (cytidine1402-2'-O)-methyltransferase
MSGVLFVCATPIGHLEDVSLRLLATLREAHAVLAEDTRQTQKLLARHEITVPLISCHQHTSPGKIEALAERLASGECFALVTDAGTPGVSDPGPPLVLAAAARGVTVSPIPGPCALAAALSVCGFDAQRFSFVGFLPRKPGKRRKALEAAVSRGETVILYESPHRVVATLRDLAIVAPGIGVCACRELTKKFEESRRGPVEEVLKHFATQKEVRGEFAIAIAPYHLSLDAGQTDIEQDDDE